MTLNLKVPEKTNLSPRISIFGVGGAGGNAINNMIEKGLEGVEFVAANTDSQALQHSRATQVIQLGEKRTEGLGAGAMPHVGAEAAEESIDKIVDALRDVHMVFITAGMGGGTGTGGAPIIAHAARELGVLTVGVVTKPFQFEGLRRMRQAEEGIAQLQKVVDTLLIIPNQNLFVLANEETTMTDAFSMADDVLYEGVKGVTDLMVRPGVINLDFADIRAVMDEMGKAMMGTGEASGEDRAVNAAEKAISNPLLDEVSLKGARGVLVNIIGGPDIKLFETDEAANHIREQVDPEANIIIGTSFDSDLEGVIRVSVVATGIDAAEMVQSVRPPSRAEIHPERAASAPKSFVRPVPEVAPRAVSGYSEEPRGEFRRSETSALQEEAFPFDEAVAEDVPEEKPFIVERPRNRHEPSPFFDAPSVGAHEDDESLEPDVVKEEDPAATFLAPRRKPAGSPNQRTLETVRLAVGRRPYGDKPVEETDNKPRFGVNTLIDQMTGSRANASDHDEEEEVLTPPSFVQSRMPSNQGPAAVPEDIAPEPSIAEKSREEVRYDDLEVPAFMRRQAN